MSVKTHWWPQSLYSPLPLEIMCNASDYAIGLVLGQ